MISFCVILNSFKLYFILTELNLQIEISIVNLFTNFKVLLKFLLELFNWKEMLKY